MQKSDRTKMTLANSIKKLMKTKCLDKITVQEIVDDCGMIRQTFYNHFYDKQELVNWIYKTEVIDIVEDIVERKNIDFRNEKEMKECFLVTANTMYKDKNFYINASRDDSQNSFFCFFIDVTKNNMSRWIDLLRGVKYIDKLDKELFIDILAYAIVNAFIIWVKTGMELTPEQMVERLYDIITQGLFKTIDVYTGTEEK